MNETKASTSSSHRLAMRAVPPLGLPREAFIKVCAIVPKAYYARMRLYYELYGCLVCRTKEKGGYFSGGMCVSCSVRVRDRLKRCGRVLAKREGERIEPVRLELVNRIRSARKILADLRGKAKPGNKGPLSVGAAPRVVILGLEGKGTRRRTP